MENQHFDADRSKQARTLTDLVEKRKRNDAIRNGQNPVITGQPVPPKPIENQGLPSNPDITGHESGHSDRVEWHEAAPKTFTDILDNTKDIGYDNEITEFQNRLLDVLYGIHAEMSKISATLDNLDSALQNRID